MPRRPSPTINKRRRATHHRILFMTETFDVTPKTTQHSLSVSTGKSEAETASNKRLRSRYCTIVATQTPVTPATFPLRPPKIG